MRVLAALLWLPLACVAQNRPTAEELFEAKLVAQLRAVEDRSSGIFGYAVLDLTTGRTLTRNADTVFPQASSIKIPVMMQVFEQVKEGRLELSEPITLTTKMRWKAAGICGCCFEIDR